MAISIHFKDLEKILKKKADETIKAQRIATRKGLEVAKKYLEAREPEYTGRLKNSFSILSMGDYLMLINSSPIAAIIEKGCRPHKVSMEGIEAITEWAIKKLGASEEDAKNIAWGTAKKLEQYGQKGNFLIEKSLDMFVKDCIDLTIEEWVKVWEKL